MKLIDFWKRLRDGEATHHDILGFRCEWRGLVIGPDGRIKSERRGQNQVVYNGYDKLLQVTAPQTIAGYFTYMGVGNGTGGSNSANGSKPTPAIGDTALACAASGRVYSTSITPTYANVGGTAPILTFAFTYAAGVLTTNGPTPYGVVEGGLFSSNAGAVMFNHLAWDVQNINVADSYALTLTIANP